MSAREWKPGDVALGYDADWEVRVVRHRGTPDYWSAANGEWPRTIRGDLLDYRPLVVIDPEDRAQVERLYGRFVQGDKGNYIGNVDDMQAALRSLVAPLKPEEPTGLGAVVVDADGERWVRLPIRNFDKPWTDEAGVGRHCHWTGIDAVNVLSEGVTQ